MNRSKGYRNPIPSLVCDDTVISDDVDRASRFNQYFSSVFTNEDLGSLPDVKSSTILGPDLIDFVFNLCLKLFLMFFIHYLLIKLKLAIVDLIFFQPNS